MTVDMMLTTALAGTAVALALPAGAAFSADPTANWCAGVKIAGFPGGPQGGVLANNVLNGLKQAEHDLGPQVTLLLLGLGTQQDATADPAGRPYVCHAGGMTEVHRIAALCNRFGV